MGCRDINELFGCLNSLLIPISGLLRASFLRESSSRDLKHHLEKI